MAADSESKDESNNSKEQQKQRKLKGQKNASREEY